jgi:enamine deaminase RidA (YjgF/YER057c/UK114 family)
MDTNFRPSTDKTISLLKNRSDFEDSPIEPSLEEWKAQKEVALKRLELLVKAKELESQSVIHTRAFWQNPLILSIIAAVIALVGNAVVIALDSVFQRDLEKIKSEGSFILESIKTDTESAAMNLQFLVEAGLLTKTKVNIRSYLDARKDYEGPSLPTVSSLYNRGCDYEPFLDDILSPTA